MISRRSLFTTTGVLAGGLAAATLVGCSGEPDIPRPTASPTGSITDQLDEVLTTIAAGSSEFGVYIEDVRSEERDGLSTSLRFVVSVRNRKHLASILRRLKNVPFVLRINRVIG